MDVGALDGAVATLRERREEWARLAVARKVALLGEVLERTGRAAERWVEASLEVKRLSPDSPLAGEEWASGPWATLQGLGMFVRSLSALAEGRRIPLGPVRERPDGQLVVEVAPLDVYERMLTSGYSAEVWMQSGVNADNLEDNRAAFYRQARPRGANTLVLGAGNIAGIPPLDILSKMFGEGSVCLLKMNPINERLGPVFEEIFQPLIEPGFLRLAYGGADVGAYLTRHRGFDRIHLTGSAATHDAIVFGTGSEAARRKQREEPVIDTEVTSELGGVCPTIVVPGPWSRADLRYQAEHIATQKLHNGGFNCVASQVLVLPQRWPRTEELVAAVRQALRTAPRREPYYPGAAERQAAVVAAHPEAEILEESSARPSRTFVTGLDPTCSTDVCFRQEVFGPVLAQVGLPGDEAATFLESAVEFCNETLWGTLSANLIVHPRTMAELGPRLEESIARLRYGTIGVNVWAGLAFLLTQASWGAYPGHRLGDIQSGRGVVHNALLFDRPQKTVVRGPFFPFPRNLLRRELHLSPKPPWFVTHRRARDLSRRLTRFAAAPGLRHLPGILAAALRG